MTLRRMVADLVVKHGSGNADTVEAELKAAGFGFNREQIIRALHNAKSMGWLECQGRKSRRGVIRGGNCAANYYPAPGAAERLKETIKAKPMAPLVSSVFQLGNPLPESDWPKGWIGQVHRPLGEWNSEEGATAL